jgi:hypothetical protein
VRVIRIVEVTPALPDAYPATKAYGRRLLRVVECSPEQTGYRAEAGVVVLWESDHFKARSRGGRSKYATCRRDAEEFAAHARRALAVGLRADAPAEAVRDLLEEHGLADGDPRLRPAEEEEPLGPDDVMPSDATLRLFGAAMRIFLAEEDEAT